jgi:type IV pilus assembly protein PilE
MKIYSVSKVDGFTIIELTIAIGIVGILATVSISAWDQLQKRTIRTEAKQIIYQLSLDQQQYRTKNPSFNNNYALSNQYAEKFNLAINTSTSKEFGATLRLNSSFEKNDPDCKQYTINLTNGKLNVSSQPKLNCL